MADFDGWEMLLPELEEREDIGYEVAADVEAEGLMMLRFDYFSIDSVTGDKSEMSIEGRSMDSNGPSWTDPAESDAFVFERRDSGEFCLDSGSDQSKMSDCGEKIRLGFVQSGDVDHVFEVESQGGCLGTLGCEIEGDSSGAVEFDGVDKVENTIVVSDESAEKMDMADIPREEVAIETDLGIMREDGCFEGAGGGNTGKELEKKVVIWWKVPLELVKFCVFRVSPLWSISVAAAMVGVFIMRRKLNRMKRKSKGLQMKVTVDDKKVDQFMSLAARLNEAFSVVKHVSIIRPALSAAGVTQWPAVSMR